MPLLLPEEQQKLAQINPEVQAIMQSPEFLSAPLTDFSDPIKGIMNLRAIFKQLGKAPTDTRVFDSQFQYTTRDGAQLQLFTYRPISATTTGRLPLIVWNHGGGGCVGSADMMPMFYRDVVLTHNCVLVSPQYRLAPEFKFPTGMLDCWDALKHIATHASDFGADPALGFVVGGESYGAVISANMMLKARDEALQPPLTGAFLSVGSYTPPHNIPEVYKAHYLSRFDPVCLAAPGLDESTKKAFDLALEPDYDSPVCRAVLWPTGHTGLPRTHFQTCGMDINRDDSFIYKDLLDRSGVETMIDVYPGCPHCFWWLFPTAKVTQQWQADTQKAISWLFGKAS